MVKQDSTGAVVNWHRVIRDPRLWTPRNVQVLQQIYTKHDPVMRCGNPDAQTPFRPPVCNTYDSNMFKPANKLIFSVLA